MTAIVTRWTAAGLNSSLGTLWPSGEGRTARGAPPTDLLPRFEYMVNDPAPQNKSRNSRINQAAATFDLWGKSALLASGYVDSVKSKFLNADEVPMTMTGGDILEVDLAGSSCGQMDDQVWLGQLVVLFRIRVDQTVPA